MNAKLSDLHRKQRAFAAHIRDPETQPAPDDIEDRRMGVYRDLFFNNICGFLAGYFPILKNILDESGDDAWTRLCRDFYRDHASQTPLFTELAQEFLLYLAEEREPQAGDPPYMTELAHYEWVEGALNVAADDLSDADIDPDGDLLENIPVLSSPAWPLSYQWPVHQISVDHQPAEPLDSPCHFLVFRNAEDRVIFNTVNPVSARLLQLLEDNETEPGRVLLNTIAAEMGQTDDNQVIQAGLDILSQWREQGIITGTRKP